jgi:hypothetical protein
MADDTDCFVSEIDHSYKSSQPHPVQSSPGAIRWINFYRANGNSTEKPINGTISDDTFQKIADAAAATKVPQSLLLHILFWNTDSTSPSDDPNEIAHKIIGHVNNLRSVLGRDPFMGEILAAHALGGAGQVKQLLEKAQNQPEQIAEPSGGGKKQDVIFKKLRSNKLVKRTNREAYEFFKHRMISGNQLFTKFLGNTSTVVGALGPNNPISQALSQGASEVQQLMSGIAGGHLQQLMGLANSGNLQGITSLLANSPMAGITSALGSIQGMGSIVSALQSGNPSTIMSAVQSIGGGQLQQAISGLMGAAGPLASMASGITGLMGANLGNFDPVGDAGNSFMAQYGDADKELETGDPGKGPYGESDRGVEVGLA